MENMDFEKLTQLRNSENGFSKSIKIETTKIEEGYAEAKIEINGDHLNGHMTIHGGLLFSLADNVGGSAARSYGYDVVTVNANIEYLEAGQNVETLYAKAKVLDHGNKISRFTVTLEDQLKHVLATGTFTYYNIGKKVQFEQDIRV